MTQELIKWYQNQDRSLPWRGSRDAYTVWISEIILQQTRIAQGTPYFYTLKKAYPTVHEMAQASQDELYALWQGLGYYSRCRNMHHTAQIISEEHEGSFPESYEELLKLPGIGPYTAAAISSICSAEPRLAVDGNVQRVLSRLYGIYEPLNSPAAKKAMIQIAEPLMEDAHPGDLNQALMDLGSQVCTPKNPDCQHCPLSQGCYALKNGVIAELPVKTPKNKKKDHYLHYQVPQKNNKVWLKKRTQKGIWQNLYEFSKLHDAEIPYSKEIDQRLEHHLTHKKLHISFERADAAPSDEPEGIWVAEEDVANYALPVPLKKWWTENLKV